MPGEPLNKSWGCGGRRKGRAIVGSKRLKVAPWQAAGGTLQTTTKNLGTHNMLILTTAIALLLLMAADSCYAVPSLIPLVPLIAVIIAKGALLVGAIALFVTSLYKQNSTQFLLWGALLLAVLAALMVLF